MNVDLSDKPEFLFEKHPEGKVPVLEHNGQVTHTALRACHHGIVGQPWLNSSLRNGGNPELQLHSATLEKAVAETKGRGNLGWRCRNCRCFTCRIPWVWCTRCGIVLHYGTLHAEAVQKCSSRIFFQMNDSGQRQRQRTIN